MMALVGVNVLNLQSVDDPETLREDHPLLKDFNSQDAALRMAARARLGLVDETLASMLDGSKSERAAVSPVGLQHIVLGIIFVHEFAFLACVCYHSAYLYFVLCFSAYGIVVLHDFAILDATML